MNTSTPYPSMWATSRNGTSNFFPPFRCNRNGTNGSGVSSARTSSFSIGRLRSNCLSIASELLTDASACQVLNGRLHWSRRLLRSNLRRVHKPPGQIPVCVDPAVAQEWPVGAAELDLRQVAWDH